MRDAGQRAFHRLSIHDFDFFCHLHYSFVVNNKKNTLMHVGIRVQSRDAIQNVMHLVASLDYFKGSLNITVMITNRAVSVNQFLRSSVNFSL